MSSRREFWTGQPQQLEDLLLLRKAALVATGELWTHALGWECRLFAGEEMIATKVCRSPGEVTAFRDEWDAALRAKGWA